MSYPWGAKFDQIQLCIESKDYREAEKLIDEAMVEAGKRIIDPSFILRQLRDQRDRLQQLKR